MQRRGMPDKRDIFAYWCDHEKFVELDITVGNSDCCMACGFHFYVERCHLKAVSNGGSNDVSNLHILCKNCHTESEMLNKEYYWIWLKEKNKKFEFSAFRQTDLVGRNLKEFTDLMMAKKFYEAAVWMSVPYEEQTKEELQESAAKLKKQYEETNP